jgi:integrase
MDRSLISEFQLDWKLAGKSHRVGAEYAKWLVELCEHSPEFTLAATRRWLLAQTSRVGQRKRAQAVRAFGKWAQLHDYGICGWWSQVPLTKETERPQPTATTSDYTRAQRCAHSLRDRALVELLWSCGLRRGELAALDVSDINLAEGFVVVRTSKNGKPRVCPLSPTARHSVRRLVGRRTSGPVLAMTPNAIRLFLQRHRLPSAHAWRRGWAVNALRLGVSESSVRAAAGWNSGAMVVRYTRTLRDELAIAEFGVAFERGCGNRRLANDH